MGMTTFLTQGLPTMPKLPKVAQLNDLAQFATVLEAGAIEFGLTTDAAGFTGYELLVAQSRQESSWKLSAYRYEPNFDRRYVSRAVKKISERVAPLSVWKKHPAWLTKGPTIADWFIANPTRRVEQTPKIKYDMIAQTRLSASYGPMQVMYLTAKAVGFQGAPEEMFQPEGVRWGVKLLGTLYGRAREAGHTEADAVRIALAQYNGGANGNSDPKALRNQEYIDHVMRRFQQCWQRPLFTETP